MAIYIKQVTAVETFKARHPVLRPGKSIESCHFEGDDDASTVHLALYVAEALSGVISVFEKGHELFPEAHQFQLRGMAVLEENQKKGYGKLLIEEAENKISHKRGELIWFNARLVAVPFYEKLGYKKLGDPFDIGDIGAHYVMYKKLL